MQRRERKGCVQTGGTGLTWKRYVDPSGKDSDRLYHGFIQLPGRPMMRIQNLIGHTLDVPPGTPTPLSLILGYEDEDEGYGDNGYDRPTRGTTTSATANGLRGW